MVVVRLRRQDDERCLVDARRRIRWAVAKLSNSTKLASRATNAEYWVKAWTSALVMSESSVCRPAAFFSSSSLRYNLLLVGILANPGCPSLFHKHMIVERANSHISTNRILSISPYISSLDQYLYGCKICQWVQWRIIRSIMIYVWDSWV